MNRRFIATKQRLFTLIKVRQFTKRTSVNSYNHNNKSQSCAYVWPTTPSKLPIICKTTLHHLKANFMKNRMHPCWLLYDKPFSNRNHNLSVFIGRCGCRAFANAVLGAKCHMPSFSKTCSAPGSKFSFMPPNSFPVALNKFGNQKFCSGSTIDGAMPLGLRSAYSNFVVQYRFVTNKEWLNWSAWQKQPSRPSVSMNSTTSYADLGQREHNADSDCSHQRKNWRWLWLRESEEVAESACRHGLCCPVPSWILRDQ